MSENYTLKNSDLENDRLTSQALRLYRGPHFLDRFLTDSKMQVLDVACGTGVLSKYIAENNKEAFVVGVDLEQERIDANNAHFKDQKNLRFERADVFQLPFNDNSFDLTFCRFLLTHLTDPLGALKEMKRVTKEGGVVVAHELFQDAIWMVPPRATFQKFFSLWKEQRIAKGQNPCLGLTLRKVFNDANFISVEQEFVTNSFQGSDSSLKLYFDNLIGIFQTLKDGALAESISDEDMTKLRSELGTIAPTDYSLELTVIVTGKKLN